MTEQAIHPPIDNVVQKAYAALKQGKLMGLKCRKCGTHGVAMAGYSCRHCGSFELDWVELSGRGKLMPQASVVFSTDDDAEPYLCGVVELEEGPLMTGRIYDVTGFDFNTPEQILDLIGMKLKMDIRIECVAELKDQYCVCFVPAIVNN